MTNTEFAKKIFDRIEKAKNEDDLKKILEKDPELTKYKMSEDKYPKLKFSISESDLENVNMDTINWGEQTALTKLLYAIVWKNGDLGKEKHIMDGALGNEVSGDRLTFHQLGKHLRDKDEPIIDQHVLRAFQYKNDAPANPIQNDVLKSQHEKLVEDYKLWLNQLPRFENSFYWIDKILFALGKMIKKSLKSTKNI